MSEPNYLFSKYDWQKVQDHQKQQMIAEVAKIDGNRLLNTSTDDLMFQRFMKIGSLQIKGKHKSILAEIDIERYQIAPALITYLVLK